VDAPDQGLRLSPRDFAQEVAGRHLEDGVEVEGGEDGLQGFDVEIDHDVR
jgi:hypothetical protein